MHVQATWHRIFILRRYRDRTHLLGQRLPMNPKLLLLLPFLAGCSVSDVQPSMYISASSPDPIRKWPEQPELPEGDHPAHGEGSSESPIYLGIGSFANNTNSSGRIIVDSGTSSAYASTSSQAMWLAGNFPLIVSTRGFEAQPFAPKATQVAANPTKDRTNPSMARTHRSRGGRRT